MVVFTILTTTMKTNISLSLLLVCALTSLVWANNAIETLPSGVKVEHLKLGTGASPTAADTVVAHYRGTLTDGKEFDSSYKRGEPILFYYWSPTPLMGRYQLVRLDEPAFDAQAWATLTDASNPNPQGSQSLPAKLSIGVSKAFREGYPDVVAVFEKVDLPIDRLNRALAEMSEQRTPPSEAALTFLRDNPDVWKAWLPAEAAAKVESSL